MTGKHCVRAMAGVASIALVAVACGGSGDDSEQADSATSRPAPSEPAEAAPVRLDLPSPDWLAADDEFVYVKLDGGAVLRLDPETADTLGTTQIGGDLCQGLGVGFGAVWSCRGTDIVRIDPSTDEVVATIPVGKAAEQGNLVAGFGRLWVLVGDGSELVGIDPATNLAGAPIPLGVRGTDVAVDDEHVWVTSGPDDVVVRVDPASGAVEGQVDGLSDPRVIDATAALWVGAAGSTVRIDPDTLRVTATVPHGPGREGAIAADDNDLWVRSADRFLVRVDATDATIVDEIVEDLDSGGDVLVAFGAVWATAYDDATLIRLPLPAYTDSHREPSDP